MILGTKRKKRFARKVLSSFFVRLIKQPSPPVSQKSFSTFGFNQKIPCRPHTFFEEQKNQSIAYFIIVFERISKN